MERSIYQRRPNLAELIQQRRRLWPAGPRKQLSREPNQAALFEWPVGFELSLRGLEEGRPIVRVRAKARAPAGCSAGAHAGTFSSLTLQRLL